ncbi:Highly reducing polyketide synthase FUM1, partial [Pseudocercospora fuligena]
MACRLPCSIRSPRQLWDFLCSGHDARSKVPGSRYNIEAFHDVSGKVGTIKTEYGYFLDDDLSGLDTSIFPVSRMELEQMDPQQRLMLEVARECLEDAGETGYNGQRIGVFVGNLGEDWREMSKQDTENHGHFRYIGYEDFSLSNRISYEMNLHGPRGQEFGQANDCSLTIRTACSSSMVAFNEACMAIGRGDCVSAIVGGTNLILRPDCSAVMSEQGVLSPDGSCKTFSALANGYVRGEAIIGTFLKPLRTALRDGNAIRAVVRATAVNHDGKTPGFTLPSSEAQIDLIRRAYELAALPITETAFVECHGTGTAAGDPLETAAISRAFAGQEMLIGSIKPNLGHTEGASGLLSILKAVLMLENAAIPPSIKCDPRNPKIDWTSGSLKLAEGLLPWPSNRTERISVNSFGYGGTNAHTILDSAASFEVGNNGRGHGEQDSQLLCFSAASQASLSRYIDEYKLLIEDTRQQIQRIAYTLARGREHLSYRAFSIAQGTTFGPAFSNPRPCQKQPKIAMVFTGQGAQYPRMGHDLLKSNRTFASSIRRLDSHLKAHFKSGDEAWSIETELSVAGKNSRIGLAQYSQPLCTAVQIALVDTLRSLNIEADAVTGHSSGEIAAAYAAGVLSAEEAILVAFFRGIMVHMQQTPGAMAAVGMSAQDTEAFLIPGVLVACDNSPRSVTISGDIDKIEQVLQAVRSSRPDTLARKLQVDKAYHSHHMSEIGSTYRALIEPLIAPAASRIPFFSSVTSRLLTSTESLDAAYWQRNLEQPVLFNGSVKSLLGHLHDDHTILLEIGPHSTLSGPLSQIVSETASNTTYIPTLIRNKNSTDSLLSTTGMLYAFGAPVDLKAVFPTGSCVADLPRYPFDHKESDHWFESRLSKQYRQRKHAHHDLLGLRIIESTDAEPAWRNMLHIDNTTCWLRDHKVGRDIVFPFTGYFAIAGEAVQQTCGRGRNIMFRHVSVSAAMLLSEEKPKEIITTLKPLQLTISQDSVWYDFTISSYHNEQWIKHCRGEVRVDAESSPPAQVRSPHPRKLDLQRWFQGVQRAGLDLGNTFRNLIDVTAATTTHEALGTIYNRRFEANENLQYSIHPAVLDSVLQLASIASAKGLIRKHENFLPIYCDEVFISSASEDFSAAVRVTRVGDGGNSLRTAEGEGTSRGKVVFKFRGLKMTSARSVDHSNETPDPHAAARLIWAPDIDFLDPHKFLPSAADSPPGTNLLAQYGSAFALRLHGLLERLLSTKGEVDDGLQWLYTLVRLVPRSLRESEDANHRILEVRAQLQNSAAAPVVMTLDALEQTLTSLLTGHNLSLETSISADIASKFYEFVHEIPSLGLLTALRHSRPGLKVLEISSSKRSPSAPVLSALTPPNASTICAQYTFATDLPIMDDERAGTSPGQELVRLDIDGDLDAQKFSNRHYDVILVSDGSKITENALRNIKVLLSPAGYLYVQKQSSWCRWITLMLDAILSHSSRNERPTLKDSGSVSWSDQLNPRLDSEDFATLVSCFPQSPPGLCGKSVWIGRAKIAESCSLRRKIHLLVPDRLKLYEDVETALQQRGFEITKITIEDTPLPGTEIFSILDTDGPFLDHIAAHSYEHFRNFVTGIKGNGIFWLTRACHIHPGDPRFAQILGMARVLRSELMLDFATCEIDMIDEQTMHLVCSVFEKFLGRDKEEELSPEYEYVIDHGVVYIPRYYPFLLPKLFQQEIEGEHSKVVIDSLGRLDTLHWLHYPDPGLPGDHELEVEMHAVGINFKDVLIAMNIIEHSGRYHGLEGAGIIRRTGAEVKGLKPGDRVAVMGHNTLSTLLVVHEDTCVRIPDTLNFMDAATMFTVYATVQHSLLKIGQLERGQSLLIHSACGGVGLAAIQIARMIGAEIFATVGTDDKRDYLLRNCGISDRRIFTSRNDSFVEGIYGETNGRGVDLVLNSLSGELLHDTWKCVAPFGRLVEIGKRDLIGHGRLEMEPFAANRSYSCVDMDAFFGSNPLRLKECMNETLEYLEKGLIKPVVIAKTFDACFVADALRFMFPGNHIGRIGVRIRDQESGRTFVKNITASNTKLQLDPAGAYLLAGGLGGLGRAVATYMVEHGARNLIFLGRRAGQSVSDREFIEELKSMGADPTLVRGSVTDPDTVCRVVEEANAPLRGVIQLTTYRNRLGLACSAINIGPVANIGLLSDEDALRRTAALTGHKTVQEQELLDALALAMMAPVPETHGDGANDTFTLSSSSCSTFYDPNAFALGLASVIPLTSASNRAVWKRDRRMAIYHTQSEVICQANDSPNDKLKAYIASARLDPHILRTAEAASYVGQEIGKRLFTLLLKDQDNLNPDLALTDLGLDSLVAVELRSWCNQIFGLDISEFDS